MCNYFRLDYGENVERLTGTQVYSYPDDAYGAEWAASRLTSLDGLSQALMAWRGSVR
ncbi:hypothetical protein SAMN05428963_11566 [Consotaella salsifontis]|uniref:Uncharacterized protein n=1 Tax=Consotaella salsifontis TaxID=1365950 RepID=A0A1T4SX83_9HYPH|nr:hypothetical protein SAMN05428963_11566 [Consotaella salsifontis]